MPISWLDCPGMGAKSQQKILDGIEALSRQTGRASIGDALPAAQQILDRLLELPEAQEGALAGSIRRGRETIGDVDILIASDDSGPIMQRFVNMDNVARVLGHGPTKSSIELLSGLQVDVRVLAKARWGTALNYFTGSLQHNVKMRQIALDKGLSLNEHALSPVDENKTIIETAGKTLCDTEEKVYQTLGLQYVPPELREDSGEIEAARHQRIPLLVTRGDITADLHMHTTWSDGKNSIGEMAEACIKRGHQYIVITDHSRSLGIANGLSIERLLTQAEEVREINRQSRRQDSDTCRHRDGHQSGWQPGITRTRFWRRWISSSHRCIRAWGRNGNKSHCVCSTPFAIRTCT